MSGSTSDPRILIVEDDLDINFLMKMVLEQQDHWHATSVTCGAQAIEAWRNGNFDVIVMDLILSHGHGDRHLSVPVPSLIPPPSSPPLPRSDRIAR